LRFPVPQRPCPSPLRPLRNYPPLRPSVHSLFAPQHAAHPPPRNILFRYRYIPARSITIEIEKENGPDKIGAATSLSKLLASYLLLISFLASAIEPTGG
jgi:hypothetical protein